MMISRCRCNKTCPSLFGFHPKQPPSAHRVGTAFESLEGIYKLLKTGVEFDTMIQLYGVASFKSVHFGKFRVKTLYTDLRKGGTRGDRATVSRRQIDLNFACVEV